MRTYLVAFTSLALALTFSACAGEPKEGGDTDGNGGTESGGSSGGGSTSGDQGVCAGVDCGGHGSCIEVAEAPRCVCDMDYVEDPDVPTCVPTGGGTSSSGSTTGSSTTTDSGGSSTTSDSGGTFTTTTDSGGSKPNGEPCESGAECQSGYCWSDWNWQQQSPGEKVCKEGCIDNENYDAYCYTNDDCCTGECQQGGQVDGVCFG